MIRNIFFTALIFISQLLVITPDVSAQVQTTLNDFFLPGSQPNQSGTFNSMPSNCGCHDNYDQNVEPMYNWMGSMMAQAQRDPLYLATLTIANQDADFSGDLCIRCHSPRGWLSGRSTPTDGSALTEDDREGIYCEFCHRSVRPTQIGVNPYPNNTEYTSQTYPLDQAYLSTLTLTDNLPDSSANGMYLISDDDTRRGPYTEDDAQANHNEIYSPFHRDARMCGTCHDVSNPAFTRQPDDTYVLNTLDAPSPSFNPYEMFPVERTYSEWLMSEYNSTGVYAPQFGGNKDTVFTCQDCHFRDVTGKGCNKQQAPVRTDLGLHDMTGGNTFIPLVLPSLFPGEVDAVALNSGISRAEYMLENAATLEYEEPAFEVDSILLRVKITNETGHKLPSGYPEGRRMWINVKAYDDTAHQNLIFESGAYDFNSGVLTHDGQAKIYEIKPGNDSIPTFHFVLNNKIHKDNRIPPRGFTNANFEYIQSPPVAYTYEDGQYWDFTEYRLPLETRYFVVNLYYQSTSKEYVEFLRDENITDNRGQTMYDLWNTNGKSAPVLMASVASELYLLPLPPLNLVAISDTFSIDLSWTDNSNNEMGFIIERKDGDSTNANPYIPVDTVTANSTAFADTGLTSNTTYTYRVIAYNEIGLSNYSNLAQATTLGLNTFLLSVNVSDGWNMVSAPGLHPTNQNVETWWPGKDPAAGVFKYDGGYVEVTTTTPSEGYWLKNSGAQVYNYPAIQIVPHSDVPLALGWSLIGLYETTVALPLTTNPAGIITTPIFEYSGGYQAATDIVPGYGYWAKADAAGSITGLSAPPLGKKGGEVVEFFPDDWGKIILTDASGINYTLYAVTGQVDLDKYELPPMPPAGMFDIRYGSGRIAEDINSSIQEIQMSGVTYPLTVRVEGMDMKLMDETGKTVNVNLKSGEDVVISEATIQKLMVTGELIPAEYALEQNYPNPFNPSTTIEFSLPEDVSNVTLSIYNALGEKVAELVNGSLVAGKYQYQWNAKNFATGMYIYELRSDNFVSVKKMVLMK